ncbi:MAG: Mut7-C ubiquitin/RNAse domain-containing protein [Ardenticatenaceae bacterium]|nr:Mut7-C ubiquitin/RNAse domain-containing protein [Ardenticatenaceae bacterium]
MQDASFRFYADLNDFLPPERQQAAFVYSFNNDQSIKHLIEAAGVPHTEVERILVNGTPVDFSYRVQPGDRVAVYPHFSTLDVDAGQNGRLRPPPPSPARFILDIHLGQLARYLRLLGFDTLYPDSDLDDADLAQIAHDEERILLSRDRGLLMRSLVVHGYCLRTKDSEEQLTAVLHRFSLFDQIQDTPRCLRCNGILQPIVKEAIIDRLEPKTKRYYHEFQICQDCEQIYWQGSHYPKLRQFVAAVKQNRG